MYQYNLTNRKTKMNEYQLELQKLKPDDEIQSIEMKKGYQFINTAGHGYLAVPKSDKHYAIAKKIVSYGYKGKLAIYLEEDCEAGEFIKAIEKKFNGKYKE